MALMFKKVHRIVTHSQREAEYGGADFCPAQHFQHTWGVS
jgi:hypothetical protein